MIKSIKQSNLPFILLIFQIVKSVVYQNTIYDGVAIFTMSVLFGFKLYLDHIKKPDFSQDILEKFEEYKKLTEIKLKEVDDVNRQRVDEAIGKVSALSLSIQPKARKPGESPYGW